MSAPRKVALILAAAFLTCSLAACDAHYRDPDAARYRLCLDHGGTYTSEDTSAGHHWTCALPGNRESRVDVPGGDNERTHP